jgi:hypothetical protein
VRREALLRQLFRISWEGTTSEKADEVMSRRQGPAKDADRAAAWLREYLGPGPAPSDTCAARGNEALNMSHRRDWWRDVVLKSMLGGTVRKRGFGDSQWYFTLPSHPWPSPGPGEEPPKQPVTTPPASSASSGPSGPSAALVVHVPPPTEEAEEPEGPEEAESRRVGSCRGSSADPAGEPAEEASKESPRTPPDSSGSSGSSGSSASFAVYAQPQPTPSSEGPEEAEGGEEAGGDSHRHGPDVSAAADEVVLDLGEIEHVG